MQPGLLPLFPLDMVLFPRTPVELHIFEERYKEMIGEAIRDHSEFGIVYLCDKGLMNTGCTAVVDRVVEKYDDGRMDIVAVGRRRFEIRELDQERAFLRGDVEFFDDEPEAEAIDPDLLQRVVQRYAQIQALSSSSSLLDPEIGEAQLSFQLAHVVTEISVRQILLISRSETERMRQLDQYFPNLFTERLQIARVKTSAATNGHGKQPSGL